MAGGTGNTPPREAVELYDRLLAGFPEVERKGATMPYTSLNGNMFSFIDKEGNLSLRLAEEHREAFVRKHKASLSMQHGVVMKEYVLVPLTVLKKQTELAKWFELSLTYAKSLKPKGR